MALTDDIIQDVGSTFLHAFQQSAAGNAVANVIAFEFMGRSPDCADPSCTSPGQTAIEEVSLWADIIPQINGGYFAPTEETVSVQYKAIVSAAKNSPSSDPTLFGLLNGTAIKLLNDIPTDGAMDGPMLTNATPSNWYNAALAGNWTSYSWASSKTTTTPAPAALVAPAVHLVWRTLPPVTPPPQPNPLPKPIEDINVNRSRFRALAMAPAAATSPAAVSPAVRVLPAMLRPSIDPQMMQTARIATPLIANLQSQQVETTSLSISFDYCLVHLNRPWFSGDFFSSAGWYVPGKAKRLLQLRRPW